VGFDIIVIMKNEIREKIKALFLKNNGFASTRDITKEGIHHKYLSILENEGIIEKVKRGLYVLEGRKYDSAFNDIIHIVPNGVICLASALSFYQLTTYEPLSIEIAIKNKHKIVLPAHPSIHLYYFSKMRYETGITLQRADNIEFKIYDKEKTICDLVFYRNKIGKDILKEVLNNYSGLREKNIARLFDYAKKLRVEKQLRQYLEVLI
jgi:predicted transcriptional regulator of viral defense system